MAKGNHVFNQYDKSLKSFYFAVIVSRLKGQTIGGKSGDELALDIKDVLDRTKSLSNLSCNSLKFRQSLGMWDAFYTTHENTWKKLHSMQDTKDVVPGDLNANLFGWASQQFVECATAWVSIDALDHVKRNMAITVEAKATLPEGTKSELKTLRSRGSVKEAWKSMVNVGMDPTAKENFLDSPKTDSVELAPPNTKPGRKLWFDEVKSFIDGKLTQFVMTWINIIKQEEQLPL